MAGPHQEQLDLSVSDLENELRVKLITTFTLCDCAPHEEAATVLAKEDFAGFDQVVVRDRDRVIGVLERAPVPNDVPVSASMRPLDSGILISAEAPLAEFIWLADQYRYRLVLTDKGIVGIVTRSDLLKLPVRMYIFMFVTHLEQVMSRLIDLLHSEGEWKECLSPDRRTMIERKLIERRDKRLDPPLLEFTEFCDKRTILKKTLKLGRKFEKDLGAVEKLRNKLAHVGNYADGEDGLDQFVKQMRLTKEWIDDLQGRIDRPRADGT